MQIQIETRTYKDTPLDADGYMVTTYFLNKLIGQVLTLVETLGLPEKQEQSFKDVLKTTLRRHEHDNMYISSEIINLISQFNARLHEDCIKTPNSQPRETGWSPRNGKYELKFTQE